jgi:hypothetical protein
MNIMLFLTGAWVGRRFARQFREQSKIPGDRRGWL